jgi:Putative lumazine-binding
MTDRGLVIAAVRDYYEGWFAGSVERMDRALHPVLAKRSLGQIDPNSAEVINHTKARMVTLTADGEGKRDAEAHDTHIDIEIADLHGNIATVVVRSAVYREYLHLVRANDGWKIVNALWHVTMSPDQ